MVCVVIHADYDLFNHLKIKIMEAKSIRNRNDIIDSLMYGLKMAGYIDSDSVRKTVEDNLTYCLRSTLDAFNSEEESHESQSV